MDSDTARNQKMSSKAAVPDHALASAIPSTMLADTEFCNCAIDEHPTAIHLTASTTLSRTLFPEQIWSGQSRVGNVCVCKTCLRGHDICRLWCSPSPCASQYHSVVAVAFSDCHSCVSLLLELTRAFVIASCAYTRVCDILLGTPMFRSGQAQGFAAFPLRRSEVASLTIVHTTRCTRPLFTLVFSSIFTMMRAAWRQRNLFGALAVAENLWWRHLRRNWLTSTHTVASRRVPQ